MLFVQDHHLLDGGVSTQRYLTSDERRAMHGERKKLNELKREKMKERKRRKILTLEDEVCTPVTFIYCVWNVL